MQPVVGGKKTQKQLSTEENSFIHEMTITEWEVSTFLVPNVHGPLRVPTELINGVDHAARVSSSGRLLYCTQDPLQEGGKHCREFFFNSCF